MSLRRKASSRGENVQTELDELQRKYRMMEVNRKTYNEDSQNTIRMQRQQIDKLKKDNDRLKEDLALETRQARTANNLAASAQIAKLQDQGDMYARKISVEKRRIEELDKQIKKMQDTILQQRKDMGGINASKENNQQVQKQIRILENRLDKALVKFNEALAHNKQLRETIDNLRRERVVFDGIYKKLERELYEKKNKMAEIIEISNTAYESRDAAQSEMAMLKSQADKEQKDFEEKWNALGHLIEKERKMKDFVKTKEREKSTAVVKASDPALEEEAKLRKRVTKGAFGIAKDKATIHLSMEKVQSYEDAFAKIQAATKINDIDLLVQTFINAEDHNFQLFNTVNNLQNEIEKLEECIEETKQDIHKYKGKGDNTDNQRKKIIDDLEQQLARTEVKSTQYEEKYQQSMSTINSLKIGIASIFSKIGYNNSFVSEMLGNTGVTESNMMQYLGMIEQRTNELLQLYVQQHAEDDQAPLPTSSPAHGADLSTALVLPSSTVDEGVDDSEEDDEDSEQPITIEEMHRITRERQSGSIKASGSNKALDISINLPTSSAAYEDKEESEEEAEETTATATATATASVTATVTASAAERRRSSSTTSASNRRSSASRDRSPTAVEAEVEDAEVEPEAGTEADADASRHAERELHEEAAASGRVLSRERGCEIEPKAQQEQEQGRTAPAAEEPSSEPAEEYPDDHQDEEDKPAAE